MSICYLKSIKTCNAYLSSSCYGATTKTKHECTIMMILLGFYIMDSACVIIDPPSQWSSYIRTSTSSVPDVKCEIRYRNSKELFYWSVVHLWFQRNTWNINNKIHTAFLFYMYRKISIDHLCTNKWMEMKVCYLRLSDDANTIQPQKFCYVHDVFVFTFKSRTTVTKTLCCCTKTIYLNVV